MTQTIVGVFDSRTEAQTAVDALELQGFARSAIQLTDEVRGSGSTTTTGTVDDDPGILESIGNFFGKLFTGTDDRTGDYAEAVRHGACVVRIDADDDAMADRAVRVLEGAGAVDIDERVSQWRGQTGSAAATLDGGADVPYTAVASDAGVTVTGRADTAQASSATGAAAQTLSARQGEQQAIPVVQESLEVGKRAVSTGGVRVYARTVEQPVSESVELREEHARVERRPVDRPATEADLAAFTDRTIEVTETAEKAVVGKSARVVEEVVVGKETTQRTETVSDTLRRTEVDVERIDAPSAGTTTAASTLSAGFDDSAWRSDYATRYGAQGGSYDDYAPAYRYGHTLAGDVRYAGRDWDAIEADARSDWERTGGDGRSTWQQVKDTVRHAWQSATGGTSSSSSSSTYR